VLPRLALVGDAAHAVHPLAGQGVNLGLADAAALARAIAAARECGSDVGDVLMLEVREWRSGNVA
jgi:2-polyprenyl-6-methoxyphenol hydroxylase-like FAD-dependent oxidoreductase